MILAFYPADWSPVCADQMALYNEVLPEFARFDAELIGISVDGVWCHLAFAHDQKLRFPLLADFEPKGKLAWEYGVYREHEGTSERALFVIDAGRGHTMALRLACWYQSWRQRHFPCAGRPSTRGQPWPSTMAAPDCSPASERDHSQGANDAHVTLVRDGDYECPHCGLAYPILKEVQRRLGSQLRLVFRHFPLAEIDPHATHAAEAAEAAAAQGEFWRMHDTIFEHQVALDDRHCWSMPPRSA